MTDTTQPDPQVVAWMRGHMRDNPGADGAVALLAYLRHYDGALDLLPDRDMLLASARAANKPLAVADIPAGQGPASLFLATVGMRDGGVTATPGAGRGDLWLWFKDEDGTLLMLERAPSPTSRADFVARWEHLAATLPHVTTEETP